MGFIKRAAFKYAKHKVREAMENDSSTKYEKRERTLADVEHERFLAEERRRTAEIEIAKRQKKIEENRRRTSGHITYNDYIVGSNSSRRSYGQPGNANAVRYNDAYSKRRLDDLNVSISDMKNNFKK